MKRGSRGRKLNPPLESSSALKKQFREISTKAKDKPCADCGGSFPYWVMDFDHLSNKRFTISKVVRKASITLALLLEEIAKCEVVCANCHRTRTQNRLIAKLRRRRGKRSRNKSPRSRIRKARR